MTRYWFKPKRYGFGAVPSSWQGWLVAAVGVLAVLAEGKLIPGRVGADGSGVALAAQVTTVAAFALVCRLKTDGAWRWRWGDKA